ncbi:hypothetical protein GLOTRDRAFT_40958, partial [Gloeophyllum trabeum ATCC 11539]
YPLRCLLFASCRKYLLRSLYHDLQSLSLPGEPGVMHSDDVELTTLPAPSTSAALKRKRPLHSTLSRGLFAICFSESCVLFFLLMCQGLDILDPRTRLVNWRLSLTVLLSAILVVVPLCLNLILTYTMDPTSNDVAAASQALDRVRSDLMERKAELKRLRNAQSQTTWLSRMTSSFRGDSRKSQISEVSGLEALEYQMSQNLEDMKLRQANAHFNRTIVGKLFNLGGRLFALYCIFRILSSLINIIIPIRSRESNTSSPDLITHYLVRLLSFFPALDIPEKDVALVARQISLALVGVIILSSIRLVLRGVARVLRVTNRNLGASLMLVVLAQLMGIYLLSTLIQLRTSFPPPPARPDADNAPSTETNIFSTLPEYQVFGSLFDGSFLIAAGLTATARWLNDRVNGPGS